MSAGRTKDQLLELLLRTLPYSDEIKNLDTTKEANAVRFDWRGNRYRVSVDLRTEEVVDGLIGGSNTALLMEKLLSMSCVAEEFRLK